MWKLNLNGNKHEGMFPNKWMTSQTTRNFCLGNSNTKSDREVKYGKILKDQGASSGPVGVYGRDLGEKFLRDF